MHYNFHISLCLIGHQTNFLQIPPPAWQQRGVPHVRANLLPVGPSVEAVMNKAFFITAERTVSTRSPQVLPLSARLAS